MCFFSIIIPIYNTERFLKRCLDSILNQNFYDYEIICVNDCSPGNCKDIIAGYNLGKIIYIENEKNSGTHISRMMGVLKANSEYCLFLDSDDYYVPDALNQLYNKLKTKELDQLEFGYDSIPYHNRSTFQYNINKDSILEKVLRGEKDYINFSLCNKITKTNLLKEAFSKMKKFYCIWFEDGYEQFHISSICKKFDSLERNLLILDETSGITTTNTEITAEKFLQRCKNVKEVIDNLYYYTETYNLTKYNPVIANAECVHPAYLINYFLPTVKEIDFSRAIKGMYEYFPDEVINKNLYKLMHKERIPLKKQVVIALKNKVKQNFRRK